MKTVNKILSVVFIGLFFTTIFSSCEDEKESLLNLNDAITVAKEDAEVGALFDYVFNETDEVSRQEDNQDTKTQNSLKAVTCRTVTVKHFSQAEVFPMTITIDYGNTNCTDIIGRTRRGKIIIEVTGRYIETGSVRTITFNDFYLNDFKIEGTKTVTTNDRNNDGNLNFTVILTNGKASKDSLLFTKEFTRTREWIAGENTILNWLDDEYLISGESTGTNWSGINYTRTITKPLLVQIGCWWIKEGIITITLENRPSLEIDFGDGECDPNAILTFEGEPREIIMR